MKSERTSAVKKITSSVKRNGKKQLSQIESYVDDFITSQCNYELFSLEYEATHCISVIGR